MESPVNTSEIPEGSTDPAGGSNLPEPQPEPPLADDEGLDGIDVEEPLPLTNLAGAGPLPPSGDIGFIGDAHLVNKVLTSAPEHGTIENERSCVGELTVRLYRTGTSDFVFSVDAELAGLIGPGRFEQAVPQILRQIMQATTARDRRSQGLPGVVQGAGESN